MNEILNEFPTENSEKLCAKNYEAFFTGNPVDWWLATISFADLSF